MDAESKVVHEKHDAGSQDPAAPPTYTAAINQAHPELYREALERYPTDDSIDPQESKKLARKLDWRIIPLLTICYFFYFLDKTTLSYAALFGIDKSLQLKKTDYSWLSSSFYFGWLFWTIPSNLLMQRSPVAYYLSFNIFLWGVFLMAQAAVHDFSSLIVLRVISGAFESIADPAFMLITSMYYTREEQPSRISAWYTGNGWAVAAGGLIGYGIGQIKGALESWKYEFVIVGACCSFFAFVLAFILPNSPATIWGFTHEEKLLMIARVRGNQTGVEQRKIKWRQVREAFLDQNTWLYFLVGVIGNVPNGGLSNFSTLVIRGLGFNTKQTALLGIPQGVIIGLWIVMGAVVNNHMPKNSRMLVCIMFMAPCIAGGFGFLLAPQTAYVGRLICFYLLNSYQATAVLAISTITSNTAGQSKKMVVSGMLFFGGCIGNIAGPFFYKTEQAPSYPLGIGSLLGSYFISTLLFVAIRYSFMWENKKKEKQRAKLREEGDERLGKDNATAFTDMTDRENPNFVYVY